MFAEQLDDFDAACRELNGIAWLDPSRCRGWSRLDLLVHVRTGLDELAATAGVRTDAAPDHDAASYWVPLEDNGAAAGTGTGADGEVARTLWLRRTASAYATPAGALAHFADAAARARAVVAGARDGTVLFQGRAMSMGDFIATWVVELAVHQLDFDVDRDPVHAGLARRTVEALAGTDLPPDLDDGRAVLAAVGRTPWPAGQPAPRPYPLAL